MRTFLLVVIGVVTLGGSLAIVRWFGAGWCTAFVDVGRIYIPMWLCVSALNLWIGVKQAGYSLAEEFPIFFARLHHSCEHRSAVVVAVLTVVVARVRDLD
jgi:hypothetical protein